MQTVGVVGWVCAREERMVRRPAVPMMFLVLDLLGGMSASLFFFFLVVYGDGGGEIEYVEVEKMVPMPR